LTPPPVILSHRTIAWLFAGALAIGAGLLLGAGPAPQLIYPSDDATYLDACHRSTLGQWLGRDFSSPIGPAAILPTALAMKLSGTTVHALVTGAALTWLAYGALAWFTAQPRMPAWLAAAFALFVAATAAAPYTLNFGSWQVLSYGMLYNRLAWAALSIATAAALLPRTDGALARFVPAGLGACAIWLWALKPNYLLILLPLILYHGLTSPGRDAWLGRAALGALGTLAGIWFCVRFSPAGYLDTHLGMARESGRGVGVFYDPARTLRENFWLVIALAAIWTVVLKSVTAPLRLRLGLVLAAVIGCTLLANLANNQFSEIPLWGALGWLATACILTVASSTKTARLAASAGLACGLAFTWQPLASITYAFAWKHYRAPGSPPALAVASPAWQGLPMRPPPGKTANATGNLENPGNYAAWLNDGLALLTQIQTPQISVLCLDWANPFPFATRTVPPVGDEIAWHVGRTVGPAHHPDVDRLIAHANVVMEPLRSIQPDSLAFKRELFAPALAALFVVTAESAHWRLWVRRAATPVPSPGR